MSSDEVAELLFNRDAHIEQAVHIQTMLAVPSSAIVEQIEQGDFDDAAPLVGLTADALAEAAQSEGLGWTLRGHEGWLVLVDVAMVGPWQDKKHRSRRLFSGSRRLRWFRADTYEEALQDVVRWLHSDPAELVRA